MILTQEELDQIKNYLLEQPTKFSLPLIQWFAKKEQEAALKEIKTNEDGQ